MDEKITAAGVAKGIFYSWPGKISEKTEGWKFIPAANTGGQIHNQAEGYCSDKNGRLLGPSVPASKNEFEFYALSFDAKTPENCYWGVFFSDKKDKILVADIYSSVYGSKTKRHYKQVIYGREKATGIHPFLQSVKGVEVWNLQLKPISAQDAAQWCDRLYRTLPPLSDTAPANRLKLLPKTFAALKSGKPWRVVMLGDSIINDTFNSNFQSLLMRLYPKADLKFISSVRGSTGCRYYQEPEHFKSYVSNLKPGLLIIGGLSHKNDIAAIRKVIKMTRQQIGCEILLMSGPLGKDWRKYNQKKPDDDIPAQIRTINHFVKKQRKLAEELQVEFLDAATAWHNYLGKSGKPWQWFQRDAVHGNDRGKQIVGRIIEAHFRP
ncbi:MAG: hypothetical protein NTY10_02925 [Candidatus Omnitrophica bacterium]|nr:hypothetical protein [Candidatus Omnitrophota bacterium]